MRVTRPVGSPAARGRGGSLGPAGRRGGSPSAFALASALAGPLAGVLAACGADEAAVPDAGEVADIGTTADADPTPDATPSAPDATGTPPTRPPPVVPGLECPPHGPFGMDVGRVPPNVELADAEGVPYALHDLCPFGVAHVFELAGWSAASRAFAADAPAIYRRIRGATDDDFEMYIVVTEDDAQAPADADFCRNIRDEYDLEMPVLRAPAGDFAQTLGLPSADVHLVMGAGNELRWIAHETRTGEVEAALDAAVEAAAP